MSMHKPQKVVVITGAASGIGFAMAEEFCALGYSVALADVSENATRQAAKTIADRTGGETCWCVADVRDHGASKSALDKVRDQLGDPSVLVNNAGIVVRQKARLEDLPNGHFEEMMAIHVNGTLNWSRLVLPPMRKAGFGRIINISPVNAIAAVPYRIGYVTAKKAILGVTEALALETARAGITVNAIAPGYILTDLLKTRAEAGILDQQAIAERTPVRRWGRPDEIAKAALYLASEDASFVTGTTLVVDGGLSIRGDAGEDLERAPE